MIAKLIFCTASIVAASSSIVVAAKSQIAIFPLSTAIPALTPAVAFDWPNNTLYPRSQRSTPPPAKDAPHPYPGQYPYSSKSYRPTATWGLSSQQARTTSVHTPISMAALSLPLNLQWLTSNVPWKSKYASTTKAAQNARAASVSDVPMPFSKSRISSISSAQATTPDTPHGVDVDPTPVLRRTSTSTPAMVEVSTYSGVESTTMPTVPVIGVQMTTKLWQPPKNNAKRVGVPGLLMGMLSLRAVAVAKAMPRAEPSSMTSMSILTPTVSFAFHPTSIFDPPPSFAGPLQGPDYQEQCSHGVCYDSRVQWCCPSETNVCNNGNVCAEGKTSDKEIVYGCGPDDVRNGTDPSRSTTRVETVSATATTMITTTTGSASTAATTTASIAKPTRSAENRIGVPAVIRNLILVVNSVRAVAFPVAVQGGCCGDFCCKSGEVCARGTNGAKCWPDARSVEVTESNDETDGSRKEVRMDVGSKEANIRTSQIARGMWDLGIAPDHGKKGSAARPGIPTLLYIFLLLVSFVAACLFDTASHATPTDGTPQTSPKPQTFLAKRWSCHKPRQDCGPGCWDPASQFCCTQPSGDYGLCAADKGESCCADKCCPRGYACQNQGQQYMCVPTDTSAKRGHNKTMSATEDDDPNQKKGGGGGHGSSGGSAKPGGGSGGAHHGAGNRLTAMRLETIAVAGLMFLVQRVL